MRRVVVGWLSDAEADVREIIGMRAFELTDYFVNDVEYSHVEVHETGTRLQWVAELSAHRQTVS